MDIELERATEALEKRHRSRLDLLPLDTAFDRLVNVIVQTSTKRAVTCLRSPLTALWEGFRINKPRRWSRLPLTGCPHSRRNLAPVGGSVPHWTHMSISSTVFLDILELPYM
jgi:hypothetical protein